MTILDLAEVSARLKGYRARLALTQAEVAAQLDMSLRTFQSWEGGEVQTTAENYERLAVFYSENLGESITAHEIMLGVAAPVRDEITLADVRKGSAAWMEALVDLIRQEVDVRIQSFRAELLAALAQERLASEAGESPRQPDVQHPKAVAH